MRIMSDDIETSEKADERQKQNRRYINVITGVVLIEAVAIGYLYFLQFVA